MNQYRYAFVDEGMIFEEAYSFNSNWNEDYAKGLAEDAAEHYYSVSDGTWKWNESISIQLFKEDGTSLGRFNVEYDLEPQFWVSREKQSNQSCES